MNRNSKCVRKILILYKQYYPNNSLIWCSNQLVYKIINAIVQGNMFQYLGENVFLVENVSIYKLVYKPR